jgi:hypothetical protein
MSKVSDDSVFTPSSFGDFGSRAAIDQALSRLVAKDKLRRVARGLYERPRQHPALGLLLPNIEKVAHAVAKKYHIRLLPAGAHAVNLLGLSEQVPAKIIYRTDGPSRVIRIGRQEIYFRRTSPRNMAAAGRLSGLIIQALRELGKNHITAERIAFLKQKLPLEQRRELPKDLILAPTWMQPIFLELAKD